MGRDAEERGEKRRERRETMTQPQQHCDHECVCPDYKASHSENGEDECYGDPDPCSLSCYHRSHPYQSERNKVLDEVLQLPQRREQPNGSMYIYVNDVKALRQAGE